MRVLSNHQLLGRGGWPLAMISRLWEKDLGFLQFCEFYGDADTILALVGWLDVKCLRMILLLLNWFHHTTSSMVYNVWRLDYCRWIRSERCLFWTKGWSRLPPSSHLSCTVPLPLCWRYLETILFHVLEIMQIMTLVCRGATLVDKASFGFASWKDGVALFWKWTYWYTSGG